ncbi:putative defense protein 3 [Rhizophagus clarus]|uniref:Putative defense protein 3 n=1 Tax=Rhizophagus clarus TaxID=94130 RepID=A0A8H3MAT1_9GLOM|nr:putative defense protein 3 [Rhizophagus clarus]
MSKLHERLLSFFLLLFILTPFYVSALPNGADTCNVEDMATKGHGASSLTSPAGYTLTTNMKSPGNFELTINGPDGGIEGLLIYAVDNNNKRSGIFQNLPGNFKFKDCGVASTTVTHTNSNVKNFPITLSWNSQGATGSLTIKSLVVKNFSNWARLNDVSLDTTTGTSSTVSANANNGGAAQPASDGFLQKYTLFIIMIGITTLLYIVGSVAEAMLKRQQVKSRSFAKTIQNGHGESR